MLLFFYAVHYFLFSVVVAKTTIGVQTIQVLPLKLNKHSLSLCKYYDRKIVFKVLVKNAARRDLMYSDNFDVTTKQNTHITFYLF